MIKNYKKLATYVFFTVLPVNFITGCSNIGKNVTLNTEQNVETTGETVANSTTSTTVVSTESTDSLNVTDMFSSGDKEVGYDENVSTLITLKDNHTTASSDTVQIKGNTITITEEGTYIITGSLSDGQIIVEGKKTDQLQLILDGTNISSTNLAPIYIKQAEKVSITLAPNSENTLSKQGELTASSNDNMNAVIYSKNDLTLNGEGSLVINAQYGNGITSKEDLVITSGTYTITASGHGLEGTNSVRIANGDFTIDSQKDGIHSKNRKDTTLGYVYIADGLFHIDAKTDGIDGSNMVQIDGGEFHIKSDKGVEADNNVVINGGTFVMASLGKHMRSKV